MDQREQFIKDFVQKGKVKGASKQEVAQKLDLALKEYDSMYSKKEKGTFDKVTDFLVGRTKDWYKGELGEQQRLKDMSFGDRLKESITPQSLLQKMPFGMAFDRAEDGGVKIDPQGVGAMGEIGAYMLPQNKLLKSGKAGTRILGGALQGAEVGSLLGATDPEAEGVADRTKSTLTSGLTGAVAGGVFQGGLEGLKWTGGKIFDQFSNVKGKTKETLVNSYKNTLKRNIKNQKFYQQAGGEEEVVKKAIKHKIPPTKDGVVNELNRYGQEFDELVTKESSKAESKGVKIDISKAYNDAKQSVLRKYKDNDKIRKTAEKWFTDNEQRYLNKANKSANPLSANRLRRRLDREVGEMLMGDIKTGEKAAQKQFATELRNAFKQAVPSLKNPIEKYHLLSGLSEAMMKEPKMGIVELTAAAASPGTGPMNLLEILAAKAVRSPGLRRKLATSGIKAVSKPKTLPPANLQMLINPTARYGSEAMNRYLQSR